MSSIHMDLLCVLMFITFIIPEKGPDLVEYLSSCLILSIHISFAHLAQAHCVSCMYYGRQARSR